MSNPYRGEITVDIGAHTYTLRLTFQAMVAIETTLGESLLSVAQRFANGNARVLDVKAILSAALSASGYDATPIDEAIADDGLAHHLDTASTLLVKAIQGHNPFNEDGQGAAPHTGKSLRASTGQP